MESSIIYTLNSLVYDREGKLITEEREIPKIPKGTKIKIYIKMSRQMGSSVFEDKEFTVYKCDESRFYQKRDKYPCYMFSVLFENKEPLYSTSFWINYCPELKDGLQIETRSAARVDDFEELRIVYSSPDPVWNNLQLARRKLAFSKLLNKRLSLESLVIELPLDIIEECIVKNIDNSYGDYIGNLDDDLEEDDSPGYEEGFGGGSVRPKNKKRKSKKKRKTRKRKSRKRKSKRKKHKTKKRKSKRKKHKTKRRK